MSMRETLKIESGEAETADVRQSLYDHLIALAEKYDSQKVLQLLHADEQLLKTPSTWRVRDMARGIYLLEQLSEPDRPPLNTLPLLVEEEDGKRHPGFKGMEGEIIAEEELILRLRRGDVPTQEAGKVTHLKGLTDDL
jgi:hypothetical protein